MPALTAVLDAIARAVLGDGADAAVRTGTVTLRPHQREALRLARRALDEFGGALLADEPGLGKTYVAIALAREHASALVVAPAALRGMWKEAARRADADLAFLSLETLSRRDVGARAEFVIVDEAHHACHPGAARYARLARLAAGARVLLLSATPVRNRRAELDALLGLFLGPRAAVLDEGERARCIIRRGSHGLGMPQVEGPHWHTAPRALARGHDRSPAIARAIAGLPPPLPALDGREARALLAMTLARSWASSLAALDAALRRRLQRGAAIEAVLDAGRVPTRAELRAWVVGDDAVQLAFPLLVARTEPDTSRLRRVLDAHLEAVRALRSTIAPCVQRDADLRGSLLARIGAAHPGERIVAFTGFEVTAEALYRALRRRPGVVLLTARGARSAGGTRPRDDVLRALGPRRPSRPLSRIDDISLVIATDVLSEGVNLQGASVVVHLDVPWTPAGLDQRVGRAARIGSEHARVLVHGIAAPAGAERMLTLGRRLAQKHLETRSAVLAPVGAERLRRVVASWRVPACARGVGPGLAAVQAARPGFLAVVAHGGSTRIVCGVPRRSGSYHVTDDPAAILELADSVGRAERAVDPRTIARARAGAGRWIRRQRGRAAIASAAPATAGRRSVLERLDRVLGSAPADERARLEGRLRALRARVELAVGAGAEDTLAALARAPHGDTAAWLAECEFALDRGAPRTARGAEAPAPAAMTILLLIHDAPATG